MKTVYPVNYHYLAFFSNSESVLQLHSLRNHQRIADLSASDGILAAYWKHTNIGTANIASVYRTCRIANEYVAKEE